MSNKSYRIRTTNKDQFIKLNLDQHYDQFEVLSLTLKPSDTWANRCSDYGVVVGRVTANKGFGVPNAKVSIFIPLKPEDESRPELVERYPFKQISDKRNNVRYNLLPSLKQNIAHTAVGTFPTKEEILRDDLWIEIYQKYYRFTTRTNDAGDFMFYGVPLGTYVLHYDVDISDIGELSVLPFELMAQGVPESSFKSPYQFKYSTDIDSLPQIVTKDKTVIVQPFWGSKELCSVQITRSDFDLMENNVELKSYALFIGSSVTDSRKHSVNKECGIRADLGTAKQLIAKPGTIEMLQVVDASGDNIPDRVEFLDDINAKIDENGVWSYLIELNGQRVITDEFGNEQIALSSDSGIAKNGFLRFRFSISNDDNKRVRESAKYIVPNNGIHEYAYLFNRKDVTYTDGSGGEHTIPGFSTLGDIGNTGVDINGNYQCGPLFREFKRKKIYTVRNYIARYTKQPKVLKLKLDKTEKFIGFKEVDQDGSKTPIPFNRVNTAGNIVFAISCIFYSALFPMIGFFNKTILWLLNKILGFIWSIVNAIVSVICDLIKALQSILCPHIGGCGDTGCCCSEWGDDKCCSDDDCSNNHCGCLCFDLGEILGKIRIKLWCTTFDNPDFCYGFDKWFLPYISFECCSGCEGENCNCYVPWFDCYKGQMCDPDNNTTTLRRCKPGHGGTCNDRCAEQSDPTIDNYEDTQLACQENITYNCSELETKNIGDENYVNSVYSFCYDSLKQCKLGEIACNSSDLIKFDFFNAWLIGTLYFFAFKYKEKQTGDGNLKAVKFCDVDQFDNTSITYPFKNQTNDAFIGEREPWVIDGHDQIKIPNYGVIKYFPRQPLPTLGSPPNDDYFKQPFDDIYYAARAIKRSDGYNTIESSPNNNMLFATDIVTLGSYLRDNDPDGAPFFFNLVPSTTYKKPEELTDFLCFSCDKIVPAGGSNGAYMIERICEFGTEFNDEGYTVGGNSFVLSVEETYLSGRTYILYANSVRDLSENNHELKYGHQNNLGYPNPNAIFIGSTTDGEEIYLNQNSNYSPKFFDTTFNNTEVEIIPGNTKDIYVRFEGNPYYMFFGLNPGKTAVDVVGDKFIVTNLCND
jgi:hypothetical protein